jgi:hypothetical protein
MFIDFHKLASISAIRIWLTAVPENTSTIFFLVYEIANSLSYVLREKYFSIYIQLNLQVKFCKHLN